MPGFIGQGKVQFFDNNNTFLSGGQVWVYSPNSTTPVNTYTDILSAIHGTDPQPNPVPLNSRGEAIIVITGPVDLVVEAADINPSTGHGSVIWTIPNFAVADAETDQVAGTYHFLNNTIADTDNDPAFAFNAIANAINMVYITSGSGSTPPGVAAITSTGSNDMDLDLRGQTNGAVVSANLSKTTNDATGCSVVVTPSPAIGTDNYITTSGTGNTTLCLQASGTGTVKISNNVSILAAGSQAGNLAVAGTCTVTGATTTSSLTTPIVIANTTLSLQNTAATAKYSTFQFNGTAANRTLILPDFTCTLPQADGVANECLVTNGSGVMSFGTTTMKLKNGSFRDSITPGTLAGDITLTLPNVNVTMPQGNGAANQFMKTDGAGNWTWSNPSVFGCVNVVSFAGMTVSAGATVTVSLDTKTYDPSNVFDTVNYEYAPNRAGYYKISLSYHLSAAFCSGYLQRFASGSWTTVAQIITGSSSGINSQLSGTVINQLVTAGDKYRMAFTNNNSVSSNYTNVIATFEYLGS